MAHFTLKNNEVYDRSFKKLAKLIYHMVYVVQTRFDNYNQIETVLRNSITRDKQNELDLVMPNNNENRSIFLSNLFRL